MKEVGRDVWARAQTGHLETWVGAAKRGQDMEGRRAQWEPVVRAAAGCRVFRPGERVLDIGCGLDTVLDFIDGVRGVTLDSLMAELRAMGLSEAASHTAGMMEALPFKDASFDRVFLMNVLDHVLNPEAGLAEVARVLRPGGQLALSVDTFSGVTFHRKRLHKWWARVRGARTKHPWVFSERSVGALLRRIGLEPTPPSHLEGHKAKRSFFTAARPHS